MMSGTLVAQRKRSGEGWDTKKEKKLVNEREAELRSEEKSKR